MAKGVEMIGVVGGGSWGTALAMAIDRAGKPAHLWARNTGKLKAMERDLENKAYLKGVALSGTIKFEPDIRALQAADILLVVVPTQSVRSVLTDLQGYKGTVLICAKGIERCSGQRLSVVVREVMKGASVGILSGPSFAAEVARGLPTGLVCGMENFEDAKTLSLSLSSQSLRIYPSDDIIGIEIGGALKNVIAIAAGAVMGRGLGENSRATIITRGLAETTRLALALGARPDTLAGLSGLGDIMLTATSMTSRNTQFGYELAQGSRADELRKNKAVKLSEGAWTADAALALAARHSIDLPITQAVADVLEGRKDLDEAIRLLTSRPVPSGE